MLPHVGCRLFVIWSLLHSAGSSVTLVSCTPAAVSPQRHAQHPLTCRPLTHHLPLALRLMHIGKGQGGLPK